MIEYRSNFIYLFFPLIVSNLTCQEKKNKVKYSVRCAVRRMLGRISGPVTGRNTKSRTIV
jgi:hypothetical protein